MTWSDAPDDIRVGEVLRPFVGKSVKVIRIDGDIVHLSDGAAFDQTVPGHQYRRDENPSVRFDQA